MKICLSDIQIVPVRPRDGLLAFLSFVLNDFLYMGDIAIHSRLSKDGIRLVYPMSTLPNGARVNVFHPIRKGASEEIEKQVEEAYRKLLKKAEDERVRRHDIECEGGLGNEESNSG